MAKKLWSVVGVILLATLLLAACGGGEETVSGTVTIWHSLKDVEIEALDAVITAYKETQPEVEFDLLFVPDEDLRNKYETAAATGAGPDILIGSDDWGPAMYDALLVADISDLGDADFFGSINQAVLAEGDYKGAQVGIPYNFKSVILMRNASIIPEAATSFDDLVAKAEAATSGDVYGALLEIGVFFSYGHLYGQGGSLMDADGNPTFNTSAGVAWLEMLDKAYELGADVWYTDNDVTLFKEGKVGYIVDGTWNIAPSLEALGDDFVIDPWPTGMGGFVQAKYLFLNANSTGDSMEAAKSFMRFMVSVEAQELFAETDPGFLPVTAGVEVSDEIRQQAVAAADGGTPFITIPAMGSYWGPMETAVRSVLTDGMDPAEALATAEQSVNDALSQ